MILNKLPRHIAIIMDGNGRWATKRHLPRWAGHKAGLETVRQIVESCVKKNIEVLTLFAFSSENWRRPKEEVKYLLQLFITILQRDAKKLHEQNVQLRVIGDRSRFEDNLRQQIIKVETLTKENTGLKLLIAANYGGQWDIIQAVKMLFLQVERGDLLVNNISSDSLRPFLSFADLPDPDLFIRTSGEMRISNFILWQLSYTELYFSEVYWPDFGEKELEKALEFFANRERRFGYTSEQLKDQYV